jgi:predicted porin
MKKVLLATTALVAAGAMTASASAAEKIKMGVGGYMNAALIVADYDDTDTTGWNGGNRRAVGLQREGEIIFNGSTTLDNGLTIGAQVQLEAWQSTDQVDEAFIYASGSWGRINLGAENSAAYLMHYASPAPAHWQFGLNSPNSAVAGTTLATNPNITSDAEKITYFTPRMSGVQLGISYTPEIGSEDAPYSGTTNDNDTTQGDVFEAGINYNGKFEDVSLKLAATYGQSQAEVAAQDDANEWTVGGQVGFAGFTIGAGFKQQENASNVETDNWNIGARYATGPWGVGIQYAETESDDGVANEISAVALGGSYAMGPGVTMFAGVEFWDHDPTVGNSDRPNDDSTVFFLGTALSF